MKKYSNSTEYSFSNLAPTFQVEEDSFVFPINADIGHGR
jgi:hypothetical protein